MKKSLAICLILPILFLSACTDEAPKEETKPISVKIDDKSELKIVFLDESYEKYLKASLKENDPDIDVKNFATYVLGYIDEMGEQEQFDATSLKSFFMLQSTPYEQDLLDRIDLLKKREVEIKQIITKTYTSAHKELPKKNGIVFVAPSNPEFSTMSATLDGVSGDAYKNSMILYLEPDFEANTLAYTIAHEYHHMILKDTPALIRVDTPLDSVIIDGKAELFADQVVKGFSPSWNIPMDDATKKHVSKLIQTGEATYQDLAIGNADKNIPKWSRYSLGRDILAHHLKSNPDYSVKKWTYEENFEILKGYKYEGILQ